MFEKNRITGEPAAYPGERYRRSHEPLTRQERITTTLLAVTLGVGVLGFVVFYMKWTCQRQEMELSTQIAVLEARLHLAEEQTTPVK